VVSDQWAEASSEVDAFSLPLNTDHCLVEVVRNGFGFGDEQG
jgi:hypothetical protein